MCTIRYNTIFIRILKILFLGNGNYCAILLMGILDQMELTYTIR